LEALEGNDIFGNLDFDGRITIFISSFLIDTLSHTASMVNSEDERMWKEAVFISLKVIYRHLPEGTEENHKNPHSKQSSRTSSNRTPPEKIRTVTV
jgi:hypothetical protein